MLQSVQFQGFIRQLGSLGLHISPFYCRHPFFKVFPSIVEQSGELITKLCAQASMKPLKAVSLVLYQDRLAAPADFPNVVAERHIWGVPTQGAMTATFELGRDFSTMHLPPISFIVLCLLVRKLSCWQTNKQRDAAETSNVVRYATTLGNNALLALFVLHSLAGAARQLLLGRPT